MILEVTKVKITDLRLLGRLFKYAKGEGLKFLIAIFLMVIAVGLDLLLPLLLGKAAGFLDDGEPFTKIVWVVVAYAICLIISNVILYFQSMILQKTGQRIIYKVEKISFRISKSFPQTNSIMFLLVN